MVVAEIDVDNGIARTEKEKVKLVVGSWVFLCPPSDDMGLVLGGRLSTKNIKVVS